MKQRELFFSQIVGLRKRIGVLNLKQQAHLFLSQLVKKPSDLLNRAGISDVMINNQLHTGVNQVVRQAQAFQRDSSEIGTDKLMSLEMAAALIICCARVWLADVMEQHGIAQQRSSVYQTD